MPVTPMAVHGLIAVEEPSRAEGTTYKDDPLSFCSLRKSCIITARELELLGDAAQNPLLVYIII